MPSSSFPGPALPAADQIMPFPGEELGSTVCGDWISQQLLATLTATCCVPQTKTGHGKKRTEDRMIGAAGSCTPRGSEGTWTWGNLSFCYNKVF